jgi:hypothetical protein
MAAVLVDPFGSIAVGATSTTLEARSPIVGVAASDEQVVAVGTTSAAVDVFGCRREAGPTGFVLRSTLEESDANCANQRSFSGTSVPEVRAVAARGQDAIVLFEAANLTMEGVTPLMSGAFAITFLGSAPSPITLGAIRPVDAAFVGERIVIVGNGTGGNFCGRPSTAGDILIGLFARDGSCQNVVTFTGNAGGDGVRAVDVAGNDILVVGSFRGTLVMGSSASTSLADGVDGFHARLALVANGNALDFVDSGIVAGPGVDRVVDAHIDPAGDVLLAVQEEDPTEGIAAGPQLIFLNAERQIVRRDFLSPTVEALEVVALVRRAETLHVVGNGSGTLVDGVTLEGGVQGFVLSVGQDPDR